jgi:UDP-glucose 4-epimerase
MKKLKDLIWGVNIPEGRKMNILVTGGTGLIGSYVVRDLLLEGHSVVIYDLLPNTALIERITTLEYREKFKLEIGDVNDLPCLLRALKDYKIESVVHLAYILLAGSEANPSLAIRVNCEGTNNVFEASLFLGIQKVVWGSSISVYGNPEEYQEEILRNNSAHKPNNVYGACKSFNEFMADYYFRKKGLNHVGLRFNVVYGAGKISTLTRGTGAGFVSELTEKPVLSNELCEVPYGDDAMNWLYVEDASRAVSLGLHQGTQTGTYTICGDYRSIQDVASYVKEILPEAKIQLQPGRYGFCGKYDMTEAQEGIGYWPQYTMEEGIRKTINFLRKEKGLLPVGE